MLKWVKRHIILLFCIIILVSLCVWDIADPPLWWHFEAQQNKKVILDYAAKYFPNAIIVEQHYGSAMPFSTSNQLDSILFEQNGVRFAIWANDGEFWDENYLSAKATQYIKREIIEKFMKPRDINTKYSVHFDGPDPIGLIEDYIGCIDVYINDFCYFANSTPVDAGWFYDFYVYWQKESNLKNYRVLIQYEANEEKLYKLCFTQDSNFENANIFYDAFQCKELN